MSQGLIEYLADSPDSAEPQRAKQRKIRMKIRIRKRIMSKRRRKSEIADAGAALQTGE